MNPSATPEDYTTLTDATSPYRDWGTIRAVSRCYSSAVVAARAERQFTAVAEIEGLGQKTASTVAAGPLPGGERTEWRTGCRRARCSEVRFSLHAASATLETAVGLQFVIG